MRDVMLIVFGFLEMLLRLIVFIVLTLISLGLCWMVLDLKRMMEPKLWEKL